MSLAPSTMGAEPDCFIHAQRLRARPWLRPARCVRLRALPPDSAAIRPPAAPFSAAIDFDLDRGRGRREPQPEIDAHPGIAELHGQRYQRRLRPIEIEFAGLGKLQRAGLEVKLGRRLHQALQIRHVADADERGEIRRVGEPEFRREIPERRAKRALDLGEVLRRAVEAIRRSCQAGPRHRSISVCALALGRVLATASPD